MNLHLILMIQVHVGKKIISIFLKCKRYPKFILYTYNYLTTTEIDFCPENSKAASLKVGARKLALALLLNP